MDPDLKRPFQSVWNVGLNHELAPGLGVGVNLTQRQFHRTNFLQNLAIPPSAYTLLTVPDPRGNGQSLPVYNIDRAVFGLVDQLDTNSDRNTQIYRGVDVSFNARIPGGGSFIGGTSTGRTIVQSCEVDNLNSLRFCDESQYSVPLLTNFKLSGTYPVPLFGLRVSAVFQSVPGAERLITYQVSRAQLPALTQATVNVRLNEPGTEYNDRINQLDFTVSKSFKSRGIDFRPEAAIFNMLNASPVTGQTNTYGANLGRVTSVLNARLVRVGFTATF